VDLFENEKLSKTIAQRLLDEILQKISEPEKVGV